MKKAHPELTIGAVGAITSGAQAESILQEGKADVILLAREILRDPSFVLRSAEEMGVSVAAAHQYELGWLSMLSPRKESGEVVGGGLKDPSIFGKV